MEAVIIVTEPDLGLGELRRAIPPTYTVEDAANGFIVISRDGGHVYLGEDTTSDEDLEPEDAARIRHLISNPRFYVLEFSDIDLCKALLIAIADRPDILIDNDHGTLLSGTEFVELLRSRASWDWRQSDSRRASKTSQ